MWISPRRHPDFGWAWLTGFLANIGNAIQAEAYLVIAEAGADTLISGEVVAAGRSEASGPAGAGPGL